MRVDTVGGQSGGGCETLRRRRSARACGIVSRGRIARLVGDDNDDGLLVCLAVGEACASQQSTHRLIEVQLCIQCLSHQAVHQVSIEENIGLRLACYGAQGFRQRLARQIEFDGHLCVGLDRTRQEQPSQHYPS